MVKRRFKNPIFLFYLLVLYVVLQFSWWLYLIADLYQQLYIGKEVLEKKTFMLVGEGSVFVLILFGGVFMIKRAYKRETEINHLQENFLLSVSHELKTPISSITLNLQTLQKRELTEEKRNQIYSSSLDEINRLESLVSNLLISRSIENKNYFLNKTEIQLDVLIDSLLINLKSNLLKKHNVVYNKKPTRVLADQEAITSCVLNLLQNASKYSAAESTITVNLVIENKTIQIEIIDEGIGLSAAQKKAAFDRFYRAENDMTRKSKGTGLGLFITKYLVEAHGGTIQLKDNIPNGLVVTIQLKNNE